MRNLYFIVPLLILTLFSSCLKSTNFSKSNLSYQDGELDVLDTSILDDAFFTPDYRPLTPEKPSIPQKISAQSNESNAKSMVIRTESIDPSSFTTKYYTEKKQPEITGSIKHDPNTKFVINDYGPKEVLPAEIRNPSFYVIFSKPVKPIAALGDPSETSEYMTIEPKLPGTFRWFGTSHLSFEADQNFDPSQEYKITVPAKIKSLDGSVLENEFSFTTITPKLKIKNLTAGFNFKTKNYVYLDEMDLPLEAAKELRVQFNFPINAEKAKNLIVITTDGNETLNFQTSQITPDIVELIITSPLKFNSLISVSLKDGNTNSVHTLKTFAYKHFYTGESSSRHSNPVNVYFSHPVKEESVLGNIKTSLPYVITKDNFSVQGNYIKIFNLPVNFGEKYTLSFDSAITDIYDRKLNKFTTITVKVPNAASKLNFTTSGTKIMEAQFPHKLVFDYQNVLDGSFYEVRKYDNPLYPWRADFSNEKKIALKTKPENTRIFEEIDLDPFLKKGYGCVLLKAMAKLPSSSSKGYYEETKNLIVQVTDLAATVRYGINKAVVMVTSLKTGEAINGATVEMIGSQDVKKETIIATGKTEKNGLAVILPNKDQAFKLPKNGSIAFRITKGDDSFIFFPDSHSAWRQGIYPRDIKYALNKKPITFVFTDRGLYKPGEIVTFRGIDKTKELGSFKPYVGEYEVTLTDTSWRNPKVYGKLSGKTSASGGFYGSFNIPNDLPPGGYYITYKRLKEDYTNTTYFDVAFFERLKFQASASFPKIPIIAGNEIQGNLNASYLAGGNLSGASFSASWFKETYYFKPDVAHLKNFYFGPFSESYGSDFVSEENGVLSGNGSARINCKTTESNIKGMPYLYSVNCQVTDVSNQMIGCRNSILVHPASFYVGLTNAEGLSGFAKAKNELKFSYALVDVQGNFVSKLKADATVELIREEWKTVQQQGVGGYVYTRYIKEDVVDNSQKIKLDSQGKISVTPSKAGFYILRVSTKDTEKRDVVTERSFYVTGTGASYWNRDNESSLRLTPDKNMYNPGETANILLESPLPKGKYLLTIEREGIFTEEILDIEESMKVLEIPIARNYLPVVYVAISSYSVRNGMPTHEYGMPDLDKPKEFFGATKIFINPRIKAFSVEIESNKTSYKPGEEVSVTLTATKNGIPLPNAELTFMAVDRGVLDLIDYHVPNPIDFFYDEYLFPLHVHGGDSRAYLMDPVTYAIKNLVGGDRSNEADEKIEERKDFNPTAVFCPVLTTDENGKVSTTFKLPDNLTTYRLTVFGVQDELFALQESELIVQNPINVQTVLPRRLRERDTCEAGILVTNLDSVAHEITVTFDIAQLTEEELKNIDGSCYESGEAFIEGKSSHKVVIQSGQNYAIYFNLGAKTKGKINTVFTVRSNVLNEKIITPLIIEKPYVSETFTTVGTLHKEESTKTEGLVIPSFAEDNVGNFSISLDASQLSLLKEAVNFVFDYPFSCLEQQSARVLPLIIFSDYIKVFDIEKKLFAPKTFVKNTIKSWSKSQQQDGGFPYWPDGNRSNMFVSTRIGHILGIALKRGFSEKELKININKLTSYLSTERTSKYASAFSKAYVNYVLQLLGHDVSAQSLTELLGENAGLSTVALVGLTYLEKGDSTSFTQAKYCADRLKTFMRPSTRGVDLTNPDNSNFFDTTSDQLALSLQLIVQLDSEDIMCSKLLYSLLQNQTNGYWKSTATTARVLESVYTLIKSKNLDATNLEAFANLENQTLVKGKFKGVAAEPVSSSYNLTDNIFSGFQKDKILNLNIEKKGTGELYYTSSLSYALPNEMQQARDEGIGLYYSIKDALTNEEIKIDKEKCQVTLEAGKIYKATIKISSTRDGNYLALRSAIPSGAEILDATFVTTPTIRNRNDDDSEPNYYDSWKHWMSNQEIYDNEVMSFYDIFEKGETTMNFMFRTSRRGVFPTPPITAEFMYEKEIFGRTSGLLYIIK